ncbi:MAG: hypothetical protein SPJ45_00870 [Anaerovoracaceae bacterium]|nr:hypothetical protein [Bacillota bacterium]MDD7734140.1 hypothetical protein [Bacillota bacterium]MDY5905421.1 hypothetical protein [Anaerovoracaceae bacterium]
MDGKMSNNKRLYKSTFSRLHYSAGIIMEDEMADNNESKRNKNIADMVSAPGARKRLRISRPIAVCAAVAALICVMSAATFAATGGETANPVQAVKVMLNGESVSATAVKADGSVLVNMGEGDVLSCKDPETGESLEISALDDGSRVKIDKKKNGDDLNAEVSSENGDFSISVESTDEGSDENSDENSDESDDVNSDEE